MTRRSLIRSSMCFLIAILSCTREEINITCPDPLGTDARSVKISQLSCFVDGFKGCFEIRQSGNSLYFQSIYLSSDPDPSEAPLIFDTGEVSCLSEVTQRPESGWTYVAPAASKHGYVFKMKDGSLGRLFIDSWKTSGSQVTEVNITRQYPY